jgi:hypothetical protein
MPILSKRFILCVMILMLGLLSVQLNELKVFAKSVTAEKSLALTFLRDVVCIDADAYDMSSYRFWTDQNYSEDWKVYPGHVSSNVQLSLTKTNSSIDAQMQFIDGKAIWCTLRYQNEPKMKVQWPVDLTGAAKSFLKRYKAAFNASYCDRLLPLLDEVNTLTKNWTIKGENLVLKVDVWKEDTRFYWNQLANGMEGGTLFSFTFEDGLPNGFSDYWGIWKIGNANVNVSEEEAISIAQKAAEIYAKEIGANIASVEATLDLYNDQIALRGGDRLVLYPRWSITLHFDKFFYANETMVTGYQVSIWADTGEIFHQTPEEFYSSLPPQASPPDTGIWILATAVVAVIALVIIPPIIKKDRKPLNVKS